MVSEMQSFGVNAWCQRRGAWSDFMLYALKVFISDTCLQEKPAVSEILCGVRYGVFGVVLVFYALKVFISDTVLI